VEPFLTFAVSDLRFLITFGVMLAVTLLISTLTLRIRRQASSARERERRTAALYLLSRDLTAPITRAELVAVAEPRWRVTFGAAVVTLVRNGDGRLDVLPTAPGDFPLDEKERAVADWVQRHGRPAGKGTDTLPGARARYVPLIGSSETLGVVALADTVQDLDEPAQRRQLEAFAGQTALALERIMLAERTRSTQVEIEAERLRTALLSSLSHDLRTPIGVITGAATALEQESASPGARRELLQSILDESRRMGRLVDNLLDMVRLESGSLQVQKDWQNLEESIGAALLRLGDRLANHPTTVTLPPDVPLVPLDPVLIEQVFVNLLENAARYTPPGTPVEISAEEGEGGVVVTVADRGPGLEKGEERKVFEKFYRGRGQHIPGGVGLGLAICEGIIAAHGGRIWAEARPGGGAAFRFTLPLSGPPRSIPPPEDETA
jgi:two-component system sensor histidine kinase KdpD